MTLDSRSLAWATLAHKALPQRALVTLLREFGDPAAILDASATQLGRHVPAHVAAAALAPAADESLAATRQWLDDATHHVVAWDDADYPRALLDIGHAPPVIFYIGARALLNRPALAVVGSRHATPQGRASARDFAQALAAAGLTVVSGLALGIDAAAHEGALTAVGSTIAVIGTGPDRVYPARNRDLARRIAERGGILSEFIPGTPPRKENFPRRNRLISGLSRGVLVVEATLSSGSLITARWAGEQGREVFAIPGSIHSPFAKGCHKLIREGAKLVETAQDVLDELRVPGATAAAVRGVGATGVIEASGSNVGAPGRDADAPAGDGDGPLLTMMGYDAVGIDILVERTGTSVEAVAAALIRLELDDRVFALPGGLWQRL